MPSDNSKPQYPVAEDRLQTEKRGQNFDLASPDPAKYHRVGSNAVILPSFTPSQMFQEVPKTVKTVVNVDPTDPYSGSGGETINMREWSAQMSGQTEPAAVDAVVAEMAAGEGAETATTPFPPAVPVVASTGAGSTMDDVLRMLVVQQQTLCKLLEPKTEKVVVKAVVEEPVEEKPQSILQILAGPPQKPTVPVVFHLPGAGALRQMFHYVGLRDSSLMLFYDDRYVGDGRFSPAPTPQDGPPIGVTLPTFGDQHLNAFVLSISNNLAYIDIVQLLIVQDDSKQAEVFGTE